jgi:uncharacterized membrane protein
VAARSITELDLRDDTGRRPRPAPAGEPGGGERRWWWRALDDRARLAVWAMVAVYAGAFAWMSVQRYRTFSTGRFDLGNMVQALWSTAHGRFLDTTDVSGVQFSRLGAHVDLVLVLFTPLWWAWPSPEMLLVAQAAIVATGAIPAFLLGRRWLGDDRLAAAGAAVYLLAPALQHATLFDFHPVTLAAPLLLFCIWAIEESRWWTLGTCAALAALTQEQVGLVIAALAVWMWFRRPDVRRGAVALAAGGIAWTAVAIGVIMPLFALDGGVNPHLNRYDALGNSPADIALTFVTRPWDAFDLLLTPGRGLYLLGLLLPLLLLPLAAPLLAAVAAPQLLINLFAASGPAQSVDYHYAVLLVPVLVAASMLGLARLRARDAGSRLGRAARRPGTVAAALVVATIVTGAFQGPLPLWGWIPGGWGGSPLHAFTTDAHTRTMQRAVDMIPPGDAVSATNDAGSHLSARRRVHLFPELGDAQWVLIAESRRSRGVAADRPTLRPLLFGPRKLAMARSARMGGRWRLMLDEHGVQLYRVADYPEDGGAGRPSS